MTDTDDNPVAHYDEHGHGELHYAGQVLFGSSDAVRAVMWKINRLRSEEHLSRHKYQKILVANKKGLKNDY